MIKLVGLVLVAVIGYQAWDNVTQVRQQNALKKEKFFKPATQYLTGIINSVNDGESKIEFTNFRTEAVIPGHEVKGYFDLSYNQNDKYQGVNEDTNAAEEVSLKTRAHFKAEIALTSTDGEYWTTKILKVINVRQDFQDPMIIKASK